jgi:hypothetical protein
MSRSANLRPARVVAVALAAALALAAASGCDTYFEHKAGDGGGGPQGVGQQTSNNLGGATGP